MGKRVDKEEEEEIYECNQMSYENQLIDSTANIVLYEDRKKKWKQNE